MEQQNVEVIHSLYEHFGRGDISAVLDAFADDAVFKQPRAGESPLAGTYRGKSEIEAWFNSIDDLTETEAFEPRKWGNTNDRWGSARDQSERKPSGLGPGWCRDVDPTWPPRTC